MSQTDYTWKQLFALSLTAPIQAMGTDPDYRRLGNLRPEAALNMLGSWWGIHEVTDLYATLDWLEHEGGHASRFYEWQNRLERMTYHARREYLHDLSRHSKKDYRRAALVERYRLELGRFSILAFDISRITSLIRAGFSAGWVSEAKTWEVIIRQADYIIDNRMWLSHMDYLFSFLVGRVFAMREGAEGTLDCMGQLHALMSDPNSPWMSYAPWPDLSAADDVSMYTDPSSGPAPEPLH